MTINIHEMYVMKIVAYYDFQGEIEEGCIHPKVEELSNYLKRNIEESELEHFYQKILDNCEFFPSKLKLSDIYTSLLNINKKYEPLDMKKISGIFGEENNVPMVVEGAKIEDAVKDNKLLPAQVMLKKYGIKICTQIWIEDGREQRRETCRKNGWEISEKKSLFL